MVYAQLHVKNSMVCMKIQFNDSLWGTSTSRWNLSLVHLYQVIFGWTRDKFHQPNATCAGLVPAQTGIHWIGFSIIQMKSWHQIENRNPHFCYLWLLCMYILILVIFSVQCGIITSKRPNFLRNLTYFLFPVFLVATLLGKTSHSWL